jgi:hypothetical protein
LGQCWAHGWELSPSRWIGEYTSDSLNHLQEIVRRSWLTPHRDREWQKWPVTIVTGAYIGYAVGKLLGGTLLKGKKIMFA